MMKQWTRGFLAALCMAGGAAADIDVDATPGLGTDVTITMVDGKYRIELYTEVVGQDTYFTIEGDEADQIEDIIITANVPAFVWLKVHGETEMEALHSVELIDSGTSTARVLLELLRTVSDVGTIKVNNILEAYIGGNVTGDIVCRQHGGVSPSDSDLTIDEVGGDVLGDIFVDHGILFHLDAVGSIGSPAAPITISTAEKIQYLAADEIHADITQPDVVGSFVQYLETRGLQSDGDFTGSIYSKYLDYGNENEPRGIFIAGDMNANLTLTDRMGLEFYVGGDWNGNMDVGGYIRDLISIGGSLNGAIILGWKGLRGEISIDSDNDGVGAWNSDIVVDGTYTLGPNQTGRGQAPYYQYTYNEIGNGSVGIVPNWFLHPTETYPAIGIVAGTPQFMPDSTVELFHYGPIESTLYDPLKIEMKDINDPDEPQYWTDVTNDFTVGFGGDVIPRDVLISPKAGEAWIQGHNYRITHEAGDLRIDPLHTQLMPVDVPAYVYEFTFN